jgi:hypothetical protein
MANFWIYGFIRRAGSGLDFAATKIQNLATTWEIY